MCGRYQFYDDKNQYIKNLLDAAKNTFNKQSFESLALKEVFPSNNALIAIKDNKTATTKFTIMKWGYPLNNSLLINSRKEKIDTPFYQDWNSCVIPASAYYEWSKDKRKHVFYLDDSPIFLAGLYKDNCFSILTEDATNQQKEIHHREPVILSYEDAKKWCLTKNHNIILKKSITDRNIEAL